MPKALLPKRTFGLGEISPDFLFRRDTDQYIDAAKKMRNARPIDSGSFERRPGTERIATPDLSGLLIGFYFNQEQKYILHFSNGRMDAYLEDGTAAGNVTSAPWTDDILEGMRWRQEGDVIFLVHRDMAPQILRRTGASTWSRSAYAFDSVFGSTIAQPYYKFAEDAVTIQPSAITGTGITITASASVFTNAYIGTRLRYLGREISITGYTNGTTLTGNVVEPLPATQRFGFSSTEVYQVGMTVEQDTSGVKGLVVAVTSTTIDIVPNEGVQPFEGTASYNIVSPDGAFKPTSYTGTVTPAAVDQWDEQVFSAIHGYPGAVGLHKNRLIFGDHKTIPDAIMCSVIGQYFNFDVAKAADSDAIFEFFGDGNVEKVTDIVSAETLVFTTNAGTYYIPERTGTLFTPTNFVVRKIDTYSAGPARAALFENNIYFPHSNGKIFVQVRPTGDVERQWESRNIALFSPHLIRNPVSIASAEKFLDYPERYVFIVNDDGTMAILHSITDQSVQGISLWETEGEYVSVCVVDNDVFVLVKRSIDGSDVYWLEKFSDSYRVDAGVSFATASDTITDYDSHTVRVTGSTYDFGDIEVDGSGNIEVDTEFAGPFEAGLKFFPVIELPTPEFVDNGSPIGSRIKRITKNYIHVQDSGRYLVNGRGNSIYRDGDDFSSPPPLRSEIRRSGNTGRMREPTTIITQEDCVPLKVLGVTMEVAY